MMRGTALRAALFGALAALPLGTDTRPRGKAIRWIPRRGSLRMAVRISRSALGKTDGTRWRDPDDPTRGYLTSERNQLIASFIRAGETVLDLGAGTQQLRRFLPAGCEYQPCDLHGDRGVLLCDFNAGEVPNVPHRYDVLVASGLLEFIRDPDRFLARVAELGDVLLLSYRVRPRGVPVSQRWRSGYLSHLSTKDLEALLDRHGYGWERVAVYEHSDGASSHVQPVYRVALTEPGEAAV
jgi:hypothetical protein